MGLPACCAGTTSDVLLGGAAAFEFLSVCEQPPPTLLPDSSELTGSPGQIWEGFFGASYLLQESHEAQRLDSVWLCKTLLKGHGAVGEKHRKSQCPGYPCKVLRVLFRSNRLIRDGNIFTFSGYVVRPRFLDQFRQRLIGNRYKLLCQTFLQTSNSHYGLPSGLSQILHSRG